MIQGLLTEVVETARGSQATAAVAAGETVVPVEDLSDFPDTGGTVDIAGVRYEYATITPGDSGLVFGEGTSEPDPDNPTEEPADTPLPATPASAGTITLTSPLTASVLEDDPVLLVIGDETASDAFAVIDLLAGDGDAPDGGDTVQVPIAYADRAMFIVGPYDPPLAITVDDALTTIVTVPGARPTIDGSNIINLPPFPGIEPTEPPPESPPVEVHGTADALVVEVTDEFAGTTTLDFHISTTPDFEPTEATLSGSVRSAVFVITALPDGTRLANGTTYYVRTVARNIIGEALPGPVASGALDPSVVSELVVARLVSGFVLTGAIQVGNITIDPVNGIRVPQSNGGVIHLPADGTAATVDAHVNARSLNVEDDLAIDGYGELGGDLQLRMGISNPLIAPTITSGWPTYEIPHVGTANLTPFEMGVWVDPATGEGRIAMLSKWSATDGYDLLVFRMSDRTLIQTIDLPFTRALSDTQHIADFKVETGYVSGDTNTYLWVLIGDFASSNTRVDLRKYTFGNFTTATTTRTNVASGGEDVARLAMRSDEIWVVYNQWEQGVYIRGYDARSSTFAPLPGTWPMRLSTSNLIPRAAAFNVFPSELYLTFDDREGTIFCWLHDSDMDPNTPPGGELPDINHTFTQSTARNMVAAYSSDAPMAMDTLGDGHVYAWYYDADRLVIHRAPYQDPASNKAAYTWYDPDTNGGTHETLLSPTTTYTIARGQWPSMAVPKPPEADITDPTRVDKATHVGLYVGPASTPNAQLPRLAYRSSADRNLAFGTFWPHGNGSTNYPPATNQFLTSQSPPGRIRSGAIDAALNPLIDLKGDGAWRLAGLSGSAAGVVYGQGRIQAGVSTYRSTANSGAPGTRLGMEATPTIWSNSLLRGFTYDSTTGTWTCQAGAGGTYLVWAKASWAADTAADWGCGVQVWKNDAQMGGINDITLHSKALANSTGPTLLAPIEIAVGDRMQVSIWQNSGTARTPNGMQFYVVPLLG
jgi:hypothetical protein